MDIRLAFFVALLGLLGLISLLMVMPFLQWVMAAGLLAFMLFPLHKRLRRRIGDRLSGLVLLVFAFLAAIVPLFVISILILQSALDLLNRIDEATVVEAIDTVSTRVCTSASRGSRSPSR